MKNFESLTLVCGGEDLPHRIADHAVDFAEDVRDELRAAKDRVVAKANKDLDRAEDDITTCINKLLHNTTVMVIAGTVLVGAASFVAWHKCESFRKLFAK
ncbi:MAG: hypothetical protein FJ161_04115 [Gammaproteobacteria bacterium]|nr:hypothetical protein [Gammaproteobacteria bacterium]